jgi:hypothetical protein
MTIGKLLLVGATSALVAFGPAVTAEAAPLWYLDPGEVQLGEEEEAGTVAGTGSLSWTVSGVVTGPAVSHVHGYSWNIPWTNSSFGFWSHVTITGNIPTNLPGCAATVTTSATEGGEGREEEWSVSLTDPGEEGGSAGVEIGNATFTFDYNHQCQTFGLPAELEVSGTMTGVYTNASGCIDFANAGDLKSESAGTAVAVNGEICLSDGEGGTYTTH